MKIIDAVKTMLGRHERTREEIRQERGALSTNIASLGVKRHDLEQLWRTMLEELDETRTRK